MSEWLLVVGDIAIPELASQIPEEFAALITNLRTNRDSTVVACTGNLGSDSSLVIKYLASLVGFDTHRLHVVKGCLPSSSDYEKESDVFSIAGVKIGIIQSFLMYSIWDSRTGASIQSPLISDILDEPVDILISGGTDRPTVQIAAHGNLVKISPGSLTGVSILPQLAKAPIPETANPEDSSPTPQVPIPEDPSSGPAKRTDGCEDSSASRILIETGTPDAASRGTVSVTDDEVNTNKKESPEVADVDKVAPAKLESHGQSVDPSFMLLEFNCGTITLYTYVLTKDKEVNVKQMTLRANNM